MVSRAITVAGVTSKPAIEYTLRVISTSWISATRVGTAMRNSNRSVM